MIGLYQTIQDAMIQHAKSQAPQEACGLLLGHEDIALRFCTMRNMHQNPRHEFEMDPEEMRLVFEACHDRGFKLVGIFHSHVRMPAKPSPVDIALAFYPDAHYLIYSVLHEELRAYRIQHNTATPEEIRIVK